MAGTALAPGDIVKGTFYFSNNDQASAMSIYSVFNAVTGGIPTDLTYVIAADAAFATTLRTWQSNQSFYHGVTAQKIWPLPLYLRQQSTGGGGFGTVGTVCLPRQTRGMVLLRTKFAGRSRRGRLYVGFPSQSYNGSFGELTAGGIVVLNALALAVLNFTTISDGVGNTGTIIPVLYHRKTHTYTSLDNAFAGDKWGTQRRSGDYGRPNTSPI